MVYITLGMALCAFGIRTKYFRKYELIHVGPVENVNVYLSDIPQFQRMIFGM